LDQLEQLKQFDNDPSFLRNIQTVKQENKMKLAAYLQKEYGIEVNPASMFDIHVSPGFTSLILVLVFNTLLVLVLAITPLFCYRSNESTNTSVSY